MQALWADGWFYISSAGLLVSGALFFFLLGQYRAAADAVDVRDAAPETEVEARAVPVRSVYVPEEPAPAPKVASVAAPAGKPEPKTAASTPRENTTGGISPAVVYLQNIQTHLYELHGEIRDLGQRVNAIASRDEALIERLGELVQAVAEIKASAASAPAPTAKRRKSDSAVELKPELVVEAKPEPVAQAETKPEPVVEAAPAPVAEVKPDPIVEPKPEPVAEIKPDPIVEKPPEPVIEAKRTISPDETIRLEPGAAVESDEKPRRGPVWPV